LDEIQATKIIDGKNQILVSSILLYGYLQGLQK